MPISKMDAYIFLKIKQLKTYLFKREILVVVTEEEALGVDVRKMLDELSRHKLPASMAKYLIEFEAFFTQLVKYLTLRQHSDFQIKMKLNEMRREWDFSEICERKLNDFEAKKPECFNKQQTFDQQISIYQAQMAELAKKIVEVEKQKASLDSTKTLSAQDVIDHEVFKGNAYGEKTLEIKERIGQLHEKRDLIDIKIDHEKTLFEDFKSTFPA